MNDEFVVQCDGNNCFHLAFLFNPSHSHVCNLHVFYPFRLIPPVPRSALPVRSAGLCAYYNVYLSFFSTTILMFSGVPMCVVLARMVSLLSTMQFSITVLSPI